MHQLLLHNSIVRTVYYPTWGGMILTEAQFPYCGAETAARSPKGSPAAARFLAGRPKCRLPRLETATRFLAS